MRDCTAGSWSASFYRGHGCYVGFEAEIPMPDDFKRTVVGERSVILVRNNDGQVNVVENVCAHRLSDGHASRGGRGRTRSAAAGHSGQVARDRRPRRAASPGAQSKRTRTVPSPLNSARKACPARAA